MMNKLGKKLVWSVLGLALFGATAAHAAMDNNFVYAYFQSRGAANVVTAAVQTTAIPLPSGKDVFTYPPVEDTVPGTDPGKIKPVAVGPIAAGGSSLEIQVDIGTFASPVDVSFGLFSASFDAKDIFFLNTSYEFLSVQQEFEQDQDHGNGKGKKNYRKLIPWKTGVTEVHESFGSIDTSALPPGLYVFVLNVTRVSPSDNNYDRFYRWVTYFIVPELQ